MKALERREAGEWRRIELQLDTAQIVLVIASLLGLCAASFYLGRWMERDRWQEASGKGPASGARAGQQETVSDLTFFDTLGSRPATEPERQARSSTERQTAHGVSSAPASGGNSGGGVKDRSPAPHAPTVPHAASSPPASPASSSGRAPGPSSAGGEVEGFAVQVFAGDRVQAERLLASLTRKGYAARLLPGSGGSKTARVRVSGFRTRTDATRAADRLRKEEKLSPWVVKSD